MGGKSSGLGGLGCTLNHLGWCTQSGLESFRGFSGGSLISLISFDSFDGFDSFDSNQGLDGLGYTPPHRLVYTIRF